LLAKPWGSLDVALAFFIVFGSDGRNFGYSDPAKKATPMGEGLGWVNQQ
jgi:hypothetical protein